MRDSVLKLVKWLVPLALTFGARPAAALPIGFGVNQGDLEYSERKSDGFIVYHDKRVPTEGARNLNGLEHVRPTMEKWFGVKRSSPLPVITSAVTENASFANFISDAIEVQTSGQADKELSWHEYTHSTMYRQLDNFIGPAGAIIHLPWMPAWFLEGLAETTSVSVGSDVMGGIERYQALTGDWPTYDRLHSLYAKYGFFERGYATAGAIVTYLLKQGDPNQLPTMLHDYYRYTMPWWWPWAIVPFNGFMPMDAAIENYSGIKGGGQALYAKYKKDAEEYWKKQSAGPFIAQLPGPRSSFSSTTGLKSDGKRLINVARWDDDLWEAEVTFDPETGWANDYKQIKKQLDGYDSYARSNGPSMRAAVQYEAGSGAEHVDILVRKKGAKKDQRITRHGSVFELFETPKHLGWLEQDLSVTRLCFLPKDFKSPKQKPDCPLEVTIPKKLRLLAERRTKTGGDVTGELWLVESEEKLKGTLYDIKVFDTRTMKMRKVGKTHVARPMAAALTATDTYVLFAERSMRTIRHLDAAGECAGILDFKDHLLDLQGFDDGSLAISVFASYDTYVLKAKKGQFPEAKCREEEPTTSPLQFAMQQEKIVDMKTAMAGANLWADKPQPLPPRVAADLATDPGLDLDYPETGHTQKESKPAKYRWRPLFLFPWIGADDALGTQYGAVTVPLMDHLQNETVRATFLYGAASRFPYTEVSLTSTRFKPTWQLTAYRQQAYNGYFINRDNEVEVLYYDEKGARLEVDKDFAFSSSAGLSLGLGIKRAHLQPYLGPYGVRQGNLTEPTGNIGLYHKLGEFSFSYSFSGRVAPEQLNKDFDYNQTGVSATIGRGLPFLASRLSLGVETSRTRGKKRRYFMERYTPLKTFIPGSGGGYNQNSFPLIDGGGLFGAVTGDTQARAKINYTMPLIDDIDKYIWILYIERLDFTAFYNYGSAWFGAEPPRGWDHLVRAHGYNVDLQLENKGVRFNLGLGTGQVIGRDFEVYMTTGFDALF